MRLEKLDGTGTNFDGFSKSHTPAAVLNSPGPTGGGSTL